MAEAIRSAAPPNRRQRWRGWLAALSVAFLLTAAWNALGALVFNLAGTDAGGVNALWVVVAVQGGLAVSAFVGWQIVYRSDPSRPR